MRKDIKLHLTVSIVQNNMQRPISTGDFWCNLSLNLVTILVAIYRACVNYLRFHGDLTAICRRKIATMK